MYRSLLLAFALFAVGVLRAPADSSTPIDIARNVRFDQNLGAQIPLALPFLSDTGAPVRLGDYFHRRPVVLVLDYYRCPNLCGIVLDSLVTSLKNLTFDAGDRYEVVVVSIDPTDTPRNSAVKKLGYVDEYGRPQTADAWHFLTGPPSSIKALADAVGFHYVYDPAARQYAHPSGLVVLTPAGCVSRYFFGIEFPPREIRDSLNVAAAAKISSPVYDFLLLCCRYNPLQGKYGVIIFDVMRAAGCLMVLLLGGWVAHALRAEALERKRAEGLPR
jgi:protein SCO1/2